MNYQEHSEHSEHLNRNARDSRIAGSLAGLGKSRLARDEQLYSSQIKIKWYPPYKHVCRGILCECAKKPVHRVQGVIFLTGRGFQSFAIACGFASFLFIAWYSHFTHRYIYTADAVLEIGSKK